MWERHPAAMRSALAEHYRLLRHAIESHGGRVAAALAAAMGDFAFAARMWGAAAAAGSATGLVLQRPDVAFFESRIERARACPR